MDDATALSERIARRELSCAELMAATLERIGRVNPGLNAIVSLREPEVLLAEAAEADAELARGERRGWMHGLPHAVKDLEETAGIRTTLGSPIHADFVPEADSETVRRIKGAGAIVIGKTNVPEFGYGSQTYNDVFGPTRNPYDASKTAGGSSGGAAAALAAGLVPVADGSDYMGSLRNPAAFCNVYGFRPSVGRVVSPPYESAFEAVIGTAGPMARSPRDLAALLATLAGPHPDVPFSIEEDPAGLAAPLEPPDPARIRIGWLGDLGGHLPFEDGILELCEAALARLGAQVEAVQPGFDPGKSALSFTLKDEKTSQAKVEFTLSGTYLVTLTIVLKSGQTLSCTFPIIVGAAGLRPPQHQGMDIVGALIGVDGFQVQHMPHHMIVVGDAVAAMHVAGGARDLQRLAGIVAL